MTHVHTSPFAGSWFPSDPVELRELVDRLANNSAARTGDHPLPGALAFVVPHAGLVYSGAVASAAYRTIAAQDAQRLVILAFSHSRAVSRVAIPDFDAYHTPLGDLPIDRELVEHLLGSPAFHLSPEGAVCDHSLEIQLPLVAALCPGVRVLPLYVGQLTRDEHADASRRLAELISPDTVLIASSDFTHYGPQFHHLPFRPDDRVSENLYRLDHQLIEAAASLDTNLFQDELKKTDSTLCGRAPIGLLLATLANAATEEVFAEALDYQTSGEITGDYHNSVSYAAMGYYPADAFRLNEPDQKALLDSALDTLERLEAGKVEPVRPSVSTPGLARRAGVFVSLHQKEQLRGCIGCRAGDGPLSEAVPEMTIKAATEDPRFRPLGPGEPLCDLEISVLTPMKRIADASRFIVNEHGAYLEAGWHQGLLLPQVAHGRNWNGRQFLDALAAKAGTGSRVYHQPDTRLFVFRAQVFGESAGHGRRAGRATAELPPRAS